MCLLPCCVRDHACIHDEMGVALVSLGAVSHDQPKPASLSGRYRYLCCIGGVFLVLEVRHRVKLYRFYASRKRRRLENGRYGGLRCLLRAHDLRLAWIHPPTLSPHMLLLSVADCTD